MDRWSSRPLSRPSLVADRALCVGLRCVARSFRVHVRQFHADAEGAVPPEADFLLGRHEPAGAAPLLVVRPDADGRPVSRGPAPPLPPAHRIPRSRPRRIRPRRIRPRRRRPCRRRPCRR